MFTSKISLASAAAVLLVTALSAKAEVATSPNPQVAALGSNIAAAAPRHIVHDTALAYPRSVVPQDREASVMLRYTIEPDGHVDGIEVLQSAAAPFVDEAKRFIAGRTYSPAASPTPGVATLVEFHAAQ